MAPPRCACTLWPETGSALMPRTDFQGHRFCKRKLLQLQTTRGNSYRPTPQRGADGSNVPPFHGGICPPNVTADHKEALRLLRAPMVNANLTISSPELQSPGKSKYKSHRLGGKNRFSSFITACCQAGFQLNFSCAPAQALLFPEISHRLKRSLLSFALRLCAGLSDTPPSSK